MSTQRVEQVNALILKEVSVILHRDIELPRGLFATITRVETSPDLRESSLYVLVYPITEKAAALKILGQKEKRIRTLLAPRLTMRLVPALTFKEDKVEVEASRIEELLDELKKSEENSQTGQKE